MKNAGLNRVVRLGVAVALLPRAAAREFCADMVVVNANVSTVDNENARVAAFAAEGKKFLAVGTNDEIRKLIGADTAVFDARGKTITPGFTDAHLHPYPVYPPSSPLAKVDLRPVAVNSDSPVSAADPLLRIQSMVTRKTAEGKVYGPQQSVSAESAIRIWTLGSASASFEGDIKGSIEPRKHADFVVLARDPTQVPPEAIKDIPVERTYVGGKLAFSRKYLAK